MLDLRFIEIDTTAFVVIASVLIMVLQMLLCFLVKKRFMKLLPVSVLGISTVVFSICCVFADGWDAIGYLFFAIFSVGLLIVCGIGWGIWAIVKAIGLKV